MENNSSGAKTSKVLNNKGIAPLIVILIAAGILALGSGGYYAVKKYKTPIAQPGIAKNQTSTQSAQDETAGWKTYINVQYGFKFSYPQQLAIRESVLDTPSRSSKHVDFDFGDLVPSLQSSINITAYHATLEYCYRNPATGKSFTRSVSKNGITFYAGDWDGQVTGGKISKTQRYSAMPNDVCYQIDLKTSYDKGTSPDFTKTEGFLDQILSTFKITE